MQAIFSMQSNSFANLFLPLTQELGSVLQTANLYCQCTCYLVQRELGAHTCSWAVLLRYTCDKQHYIRAAVFCSCSHLFFFFKSLCRLLVKLQELNYNLKVKVLFDKYVVFFSFFSMRKQSRPRSEIQKAARLSKCWSRPGVGWFSTTIGTSFPYALSLSLSPQFWEMSQRTEGLQ